MKKSLTTLVMLPAVLVSSAYAKEKIVYGVDNRVEVYEATQQEQELAKSTAGMIQNEKLIELKDGYMLPPSTISSDMGLCHSERFSSQPSAVICSGFLVAPDLLVTAGHCIETQDDCNKMSWVFDYKIKKESGR